LAPCSSTSPSTMMNASGSPGWTCVATPSSGSAVTSPRLHRPPVAEAEISSHRFDLAPSLNAPSAGPMIRIPSRSRIAPPRLSAAAPDRRSTPRLSHAGRVQASQAPVKGDRPNSQRRLSSIMDARGPHVAHGLFDLSRD
jgi:hypothetical protein